MTHSIALRSTLRVTLCLMGIGITSTASGMPVQWLSSDGGNDHWYEYISESENIDWTTARTNALAKTYAGLPGYLVNITSASENSFVLALKPGSLDGTGEAWIGATDQVVEGEWRWADGPEAGQLFWLGDFSGQAFAYSNWRSLEPNNAGRVEPGEDWGHLIQGTSGQWNDRENRPTGGYLVEYSSLSPVPEPGNYAMMVIGLALVGFMARRRGKTED